jgi:hypothetical protein
MISLKSNVPRFLTCFSQELDQEVSKNAEIVLTNLEGLKSLRKSQQSQTSSTGYFVFVIMS